MPGSLKVDDILEFCRPSDRHVCSALTLEYSTGINPNLPVALQIVCAIAHQPPCFYEFAKRVDNGKHVSCRMDRKLHPTIGEHWIRHDYEGFNLLLHHGIKSCVNFTCRGRSKYFD